MINNLLANPTLSRPLRAGKKQSKPFAQFHAKGSGLLRSARNDGKRCERLGKSRQIVYHYLLEDHAKRHPDKPLLLMGGRAMSYAEADRAANRIGRGFAAHGVVKGDRVLVMLPSSIDYVLVWLGLSKIGALMVPVNEAYKAGMLQHQVNNSGARLAVIWNGRIWRLWRDIAAMS